MTHGNSLRLGRSALECVHNNQIAVLCANVIRPIARPGLGLKSYLRAGPGPRFQARAGHYPIPCDFNLSISL